MTVAEARKRFSYREFLEWTVFEQLDPDMPERLEIMIGKLILVMSQAFGDRKRRTLKDVIPDYEDLFFQEHDPKYRYQRLASAFSSAGMLKVASRKEPSNGD